MTGSTLYDDDILLWSEQQAEAIRRLGRTRRDLPNELDVENVAEEIESVGRSELAAVESQIQNILVHLIKLATEPESDAARHWRGEIIGFHGEALRRYAPSMRQRLDVDKLWRFARKLSVVASEQPAQLAEALPLRSPVSVDQLVAEELEISELVGLLGREVSKTSN